MLKVRCCLWAIGLLLASVIVCAAQTVTVDARASIFGAGYAGPSSDGSGAVPTSVDVQGLGAVSFPTVTGFTTPGASGPIDNGPDGGTAAIIVNMNSWGGISGIIDGDGRIGALYGVFTSGPIPFGQAAPARLNVTGPFKSQESFAPLLNQAFFIGDGRTGLGAGALQSFTVPAGATHLFLGFLDGYAFDGNPQLYYDNRGSLTVEVSSGIEPPTKVKATQIGNSGTRIQLTWDYGSNPIDGFKIERQSPSENQSNTWHLVSVASSETTPGHWLAVDAGVTAAYATYTYRIRAYSGTSESENSMETTAFQLKLSTRSCGLGPAVLPPDLRTGCTSPNPLPLFLGINNAIGADFAPDPNATLFEVAQLLNYDHFNWISTISYLSPSVTDFKDYNHNQLPPIDQVTGTRLPYLDPPLGGYDYWHNDFNTTCGSTGPTNDFLPYYYDEQLGCVGGVFLPRYISTDQKKLDFFDSPHSPQFDHSSYIQFVTSLVGVPNGSGTSKILATFFWSSNNKVFGVGQAQSENGTFSSGTGGIFNVSMIEPDDLPLNVRKLLIQSGVQGLTTAPKSDKDAPMTASFLSGLQGPNDTYTGTVMVSLIATDVDGQLDIASTSYIVDGSPVLNYGSPFTVSGDGLHTIQFHSVDLAGNVETPSPSQTFRIDATLPSITCGASSKTLWPPNGKPIRVTISGSISDATSGIDLGSATFRVTDEYGEVEPAGIAPIGPGGNYSFGVSLLADRNGKDKDGRKYTIEISGRDQAGNSGSCSTVVTVPHDQGK